MYLPLDFNSLSLLLLIISAVLLITVQLIQSYDGFLTIYVIKGRLFNAALITSALFLITIVIRVCLMLLAGVEYPPYI